MLIVAAVLALGLGGALLWAGLKGAPPPSTVDAPVSATTVPLPPLAQEAPPPPVTETVVEEAVEEDAPAIIAADEPVLPDAPEPVLEEVPAEPPAEEPPPAVEPADPAPEGTRLAAVGGGSNRPGVLLPAPLPGLAEETPDGLLPVIAPDGRQSWQVYARPYDFDDPRPKIAIVLIDLGLNRAATNVAIQLPGAVTLAFSPYARDLGSWIDLARTAGHEVLLQLPMEPPAYPEDDLGPQMLLTSLSADQNVERLSWHLGRFPGYVGVIDYLGGRFAASPDHLLPVLDVLKNRGLLVLDSGVGTGGSLAAMADQLGAVTVRSDLILDAKASRAAIGAQFAELERRARANGSAAAIGQLFPVTIELLTGWLPTLEDKGIALAPISALAADR